MNKNLLRNFSWRTIQIFVKQGVSLLIFGLAFIFLDKNQFGIYSYYLAIAFFVSMFCDFGISTSVSKYASSFFHTDLIKFKKLAANSLIMVLFPSLLLVSLLFIFGRYIWQENYFYILLLTPLIIFSPVTSVLDGLYRGVKRFKELTKMTTYSAIFSLPIIFFLVREYGLIGALLAQDFFYIILFLVLYRNYDGIEWKVDLSIIREVGGYAFVFGLAVLGYYLFSRIDIIVLGQYGFFPQIATYELLNKIFIVPLTAFSILGQVIAPDFTEIYSKSEYSKLLESYKKYFIITSIFSIFVAIVLYLLIPALIQLFIPNYYDENLTNLIFPCAILYALQFMAAPINSGIVVSTGYAKLMTYMNLVIGIMNLLLCYIFIEYYGYVGVLYATVISNYIGYFVLQLRFYNILKKKI